MKDFAKSIVCNTKAEVVKVGNIAADITTDGNTWFVTTSDGKKEEFPSEREAEEYVKKIKAGNKKVGNAYTEADRKRLYELARKRNKTAAEWAEFDELNRREEQASKEMLKKLGKTKNSTVGNADPRIASLKAKIKQHKGDIGALKDVLSLAESMIKDLEGRKRQLLDEAHKIDIDLDGWLDLKSELKFMI